MNNSGRRLPQPSAQPGQPPKEAVQAMLAQVGMLIERKQEIVEGIAVFQDGANKLLEALKRQSAVPVSVDAITNAQMGALKIAKGHAGILLAEIGELQGTYAQMEAQLAQYDQKVRLA